MSAEIAEGPRRFALAMPDVEAADTLAREWGESVWTDNRAFRGEAIRVASTLAIANYVVGKHKRALDMLGDE